MTRVMLAVLVVLLVAPANALAGWSEPRVFRGKANAWAPALDVNARGDAVVAWSAGGRVTVALAPAGRGFGKPVVVDPVKRLVLDPQVDIDDAGNVAVGWTYSDGTVVESEEDPDAEACCTQAAGALKPAGRPAFGAARTLSNAGYFGVSLDVAAGPRGGGFLWAEEQTLRAAFGERGGSIGRSSKLGRPRKGGYFGGTSILMDATGRASLVVDDRGVLFERVRLPDGRLGRTRRIGKVGGPFFFNERFGDAAGNETVVWSETDEILWATRARGAARLGPIRSVRQSGFFRAAFAPDGGLLLMSSDTRPERVEASIRKAAAAVFTRSVRLAVGPPDEAFFEPAPALGNRGRGVVAWTAAEDWGHTTLSARAWRGAGPVGPVKRLSLPGQRRFRPQSPVAAAAASGRTLVVWEQGRRIGVARYTP